MQAPYCPGFATDSTIKIILLTRLIDCSDSNVAEALLSEYLPAHCLLDGDIRMTSKQQTKLGNF